jgi:hypothetical protein
VRTTLTSIVRNGAATSIVGAHLRDSFLATRACACSFAVSKPRGNALHPAMWYLAKQLAYYR